MLQMSSLRWVALYNKVKSGLKRRMPLRVALFLSAPSTLCGSSIIMMGRVLARMSMGRREPNSSRREKMMRAAASPLRPSPRLFSSFIEALKACVLMIITCSPLSLAKPSIFGSCFEL